MSKEPKTAEHNEDKYPCADCGTLRSEAEGGKIFTVCDKCWELRVMQFKEAMASVKLDGDTMDCTRCPLGKDYRKQIIEGIDKLIFSNSLNHSWHIYQKWQQFRRGE